MSIGSDVRRQMADQWNRLVAEYPHWYSFFTDGIDDDWNWVDEKVEPWLSANAKLNDDYTGRSDPAGFVYTIMFKDKALFDRFHADCIVGSPSYARRVERAEKDAKRD